MEIKRKLGNLLTILLSNGRKGTRCKKSHILTSSTACDDLSPQARGADPKQRCLELKTELELNYKACTLYILSILLDFCLLSGQAREGHIRNCVSVMEEKVLTSY